MSEKWKGAAAIARTASASGTASPAVVFTNGTANISPTPKSYDRSNTVTRARLQPQHAGEDLAFSMSDLEVTAHELGYLLWLFLGKQSTVDDVHTLLAGLAAAEGPEYLAYFKDAVLDLGSSTPTEVLLGAKLSNLDIEVRETQFAKVNFSGIGCSGGDPVAALVPSIAAGANNAPLSWAALIAGDFKTSLGAGALTEETGIERLKISLSQDLTARKPDLNGNQPSAIYAGDVEIVFEWDRVFEGASALSEYVAQRSGTKAGVQAKFLMGTSYVDITVPHAEITDPYTGEIGEGTDPIMATLKAKAFLDPDGVDELITAIVKDGATGDYT